MTDQTATETVPTETDLEPDAATPVTDPGDEDTGPGREAAKWRRKLREVEAERDELVAQLDATRRAVVEGMLPAHEVTAELFWLAGTDPASLVDENGAVVAELVDARATEIAANFLVRSKIRNPSQSGPVGDHPRRPRLSDAFAATGFRQ